MIHDSNPPKWILEYSDEKLSGHISSLRNDVREKESIIRAIDRELKSRADKYIKTSENLSQENTN